ncbi:MAG: cytochrome-c oxidase, cbb3-type subunit III [Qingshengfaniella sp.]
MSDHDHKIEIDPVSGYGTTGHDWAGIKELNRPFPKLVLWALGLTFTYSVIAWILLPAWPVGRDGTPGLLKLDQGVIAMEDFARIEDSRQDWMGRFASDDYAALAADAGLMATAMPAAERLFADNCAACHGAEGRGGPGYPVLSDGYWLWGGTPDQIAETIRVGINAEDLDTRIAEMAAYDWMSFDERTALAHYVAGLKDGTADQGSPAATVFAENCASCHGDGGVGGLEVGAPSLTDGSVIFGQDEATVMDILRHGRRSVMPAWAGRLSDADINLLTVYVAGLDQGAEGQVAE